MTACVSEPVPVIEWAVVSSCAEDSVSRLQIENFFCWLVEQLHNQSQKKGLHLNFAANFQTVLVVGYYDGDKSSAKRETEAAYRSILNDYPSVTVVFHLLPGSNSEEYAWMKEFSWKYGLVCQGVQQKNVLNYFETAEAKAEDVFSNMCSWLEKRLGHIAHGTMSQRVYSLKITIDNKRKAAEITKEAQMQAKNSNPVD